MGVAFCFVSLCNHTAAVRTPSFHPLDVCNFSQKQCGSLERAGPELKAVLKPVLEGKERKLAAKAPHDNFLEVKAYHVGMRSFPGCTASRMRSVFLKV